MVNAKTAMAICLALLLLLVQDVHARKLSSEVQEKHTAAPLHGRPPYPASRSGSTILDAIMGPCSENEVHRAGAKQQQSQQLQRDPTKWEEIHTDYIYTQDVKHP